MPVSVAVGSFGDDALIPLMLASGRQVFHMLLIVAALTNIVYAAKSTTGGGSSDFPCTDGPAQQQAYPGTSLRDSRCRCAACSRPCAGRRNDSFGEGIAQCRNYFLMHMGLVIFAGVGALAILFVKSLPW